MAFPLKITLPAPLRASPGLLLLCLGMLILPVSNAIGQVPLYLASLHWVWHFCRRPTRLPRGDVLFLLIFALLIASGLLFGVRPGNTLSKLNRLLLFPLVFAVPEALRRSREPAEGLKCFFLAYLAGMVVHFLFDAVRIPLEMRQGTAFVDTGNMTSPQLYMVALFLLLGLRAEWHSPRRIWLFALLCALAVGGMLLHNKRGVWLAAAAVVPVWTLWTRQWRTLAGLLLVGVLAFSLPTVRSRLLELRAVVQPTHGGRMVLWREVAPRILPEHPWGMGYSATEYTDFREILPRNIHLEPGLKHLHSNFLQLRLELGWHGLIFWLIWMGTVLWQGFRRRPATLRLARFAVACCILALLVNGVVEYNFGNSEVFMTFLTLFGLLAGLHEPNAIWKPHEAAPAP